MTRQRFTPKRSRADLLREWDALPAHHRQMCAQFLLKYRIAGEHLIAQALENGWTAVADDMQAGWTALEVAKDILAHPGDEP